MPKYYEISEAAAKRAKDMNSYSDYAPGSATAGYRAMVDEAYALAEKQKAQVDPMYHDKIDALVDRYARRLAENLNERNAIDARVPSILITGGGNFPVAKKAKQNAARDRNYGEYAEIEKLLDKIRSTGRGRWKRSRRPCPKTGAKTPFRFHPICSPTITPTSAVCASALRN